MANSLVKGKKLLILGATSGETTLVKRAQKWGVHTIVADYNKDYKLSPAKYIADEVWDVSWSDLDTLEKLCIEKQIDGVIAGYSEFRVENMIKLCQRLNLHSYATIDQLEVTRNKQTFKDECQKCGIPVVKGYVGIDEVDKYPVIVKPTDRAGSIGVGIAHDYEELKKAYEYAMEMSVEKKVIIEDYIENGTEIDFQYMINNGEISLISSNDIISAKENGTEKVVQSAWLLPERYENAFKVQADEAIRRMITCMGIQYGTIFFSGFLKENKEFVFFECGYRMWGEHDYNYVERKGFVNFLDLYIWYALLGDTKNIPLYENANPNLKGAILNFYVKSGTITEINGMDEIAKIDDCVNCITSAYIGQVCKDDKAILTKAGLVMFCSESPEKLQEDVKKAYELIEVKDENGNDMLFDRIDYEIISDWWK